MTRSFHWCFINLVQTEVVNRKFYVHSQSAYKRLKRIYWCDLAQLDNVKPLATKLTMCNSNMQNLNFSSNVFTTGNINFGIFYSLKILRIEVLHVRNMLEFDTWIKALSPALQKLQLSINLCKCEGEPFNRLDPFSPDLRFPNLKEFNFIVLGGTAKEMLVDFINWFLSRHNNLEVVNLDPALFVCYSMLGNTMLQHLNELQNLSKLSLYDLKFDQACCEQLINFCHRLDYLYLRFCYFDNLISLKNIIASARRLKELSLNSIRIRPTFGMQLNNGPVYILSTTLVNLVLNLTSPDLQDFAPCALQTLFLGCDDDDHELATYILHYLNTLIKLEITFVSHLPLGSNSFYSWLYSDYMIKIPNSLKELHLRISHIPAFSDNDKAFHNIAYQFPNLTKFTIQVNNVTKLSMDNFCKQLVHLESVCLYFVDPENVDLHILSALFEHPKMINLQINRNLVDRLKSDPYLQSLIVNKNFYIGILNIF